VRPKWLGTAGDCVDWQRSEVAAVERVWRVPIHQEDFASGDNTTALPHRKQTALAVTVACRTHGTSVDRHEQIVPADGLACHSEDTLDQWNAGRQIASFREKGR
jgi:hypothetical protein